MKARPDVYGCIAGAWTYQRRLFVRPNVGAKATAEADADWPRKENLHRRLERPGGGCRSGSPP